MRRVLSSFGRNAKRSILHFKAPSMPLASFSSAARKMTLSDLNVTHLKGKNVLVRVDFNVPVNKQTGEISDDTRIRAALPSIEYLTEHGARVILATHMGRPKGKVSDALRLDKAAARLSELIGQPVRTANDCVGLEVEEATSAMQDGELLVLENVRFHAGETKNDLAFAQNLATSTGAQVFVNDAFGTAHRAHASTAGVAGFIPGPKVAGFLLDKELSYLKKSVDEPERPFAAIVGGAKVSTKISVLDSLLDKTDKLIIGGAMIFTFFKAQGLSVGESMVEEDALDVALACMKKAEANGVELILPKDVVIADKFAEDAAFKVVSIDQIPDDWLGLDVGPQFSAEVKAALAPCKTILWNGPMGVFEWENFSAGTFGVAQSMAECTARGAVTIVGGGDSVAAVEAAGLASQMSHISTGGGASLELLEGKELPGVAALDDFKESPTPQDKTN